MDSSLIFFNQSGSCSISSFITIRVFSWKISIVAIRLAAMDADQVRDTAQDQAAHTVLFCHPGNCPGFPVCRYGCVLFNQAGDITCYDVSICRDEQTRLDGMRIRLVQPGKIKFGGIMRNGLFRIGHLLDNIVDDCFGNQDDGATGYAAFKTTAGPQVDQQIGLEMVDDILGCGGG